MKRGFTLAELLIALAILGVIATFTIPKVLNSQTDTKYKSMGKEAVQMVSGALQAYKLNNTLSASTGSVDLTPYLNYVSVITTGSVDGEPGLGTYACNTTTPCLLLHNGGILRYRTNNTFGDTASVNYVWFLLDPDAAPSSYKGLRIDLYTNGRVVDRGSRPAGSVTYEGAGPIVSGATDPTLTPSWFGWD